jgi:hypothetical protein
MCFPVSTGQVYMLCLDLCKPAGSFCMKRVTQVNYVQINYLLHTNCIVLCIFVHV